MCALCTCTMYIHESPPGTFILPNYDVVVLALGLYVYVQCQPTVCIISIIHHFLGQETLCHLLHCQVNPAINQHFIQGEVDPRGSR